MLLFEVVAVRGTEGGSGGAEMGVSTLIYFSFYGGEVAVSTLT